MDAEHIAAMRRSYSERGIDERELDADPIAQFAAWLADAEAAGVIEPNAMVLATADADGRPSARTVLLKGLDTGFVFYTNYASRKGIELARNPAASLVFPWYSLERQVLVAGAVERVDRATAAFYFSSRPRGSRLSAWASPQSEVVASRADLDAAFAEASARWPEGVEIPLPDQWGGFRVLPDSIEFWQGRPDRLHDRLRYRRVEGVAGAGAGPRWLLERVAP